MRESGVDVGLAGEPPRNQPPHSCGVDCFERLQQGLGAIVVNPGDEITQRSEGIQRAIHSLQGRLDERLGHVAPRLFRSDADSLANALLRGGDVEDRYLVVPKLLPHLSEMLLVELRISQGAIYPNILQVGHGNCLRYLHHEGRLFVAAGAGFAPRFVYITWPLGHHQLESIWVDMHNTLEGKVSMLAHPGQSEAFANAHRSTSVN
mmetsp:Transcript_810/g.1772  ORF Transcript_810/g.1772 Transcript_810/m.1772 type:complete len:206 (-) Transcript_810:680-1297(-)